MLFGVGVQGQVRVQWAHADLDDVHRWIVHYRRGAHWHYEVFNSAVRETQIPLVSPASEQGGDDPPQVLREVAVSALDRFGNESPKTRMPIEERPE